MYYTSINFPDIQTCAENGQNYKKGIWKYVKEEK